MTGMPEDPRPSGWTPNGTIIEQCGAETTHGEHEWYTPTLLRRQCLGYVGRAGVPAASSAAEGASEAAKGSIDIDELVLRYGQEDLVERERAAYERGKAEQAAEVERLQVLLEHAEQYARDFQDEAGWDRTEEWALSYKLNGDPKPPERSSHVFDSREEAERHIEAWRRHYPDLTYTDEVYHRREVLTGEWLPEEASDAH